MHSFAVSFSSAQMFVTKFAYLKLYYINIFNYSLCLDAIFFKL